MYQFQSILPYPMLIDPCKQTSRETEVQHCSFHSTTKSRFETIYVASRYGRVGTVSH